MAVASVNLAQKGLVPQKDSTTGIYPPIDGREYSTDIDADIQAGLITSAYIGMEILNGKDGKRYKVTEITGRNCRVTKVEEVSYGIEIE